MRDQELQSDSTHKEVHFVGIENDSTFPSPESDPPAQNKALTFTARLQKYLNFYRLHLLYFLSLDLLGTFILWLSPPTSLGRISFIDALYTVTSALTCTGLSPVTMVAFTNFQLALLMCLMLLGGQVFLSLLPVLIRRYYFHTFIQKEREKLESRDHGLENSGAQGADSAVPSKLERIEEQAADSRSARENFEGESEWHFLEENAVLLSNEGSYKVDEIAAFEGAVKERPTAVRAAAEALTEANRKVTAKRESSPQFPSAVTWSGETAMAQGSRFKLALEIFKEKQQKESGNRGEEEKENGGGDRGESAARGSISQPLTESKRLALNALDLRTQEYWALHALSWLVPCYLAALLLVSFLAVRINFLGAPGQRKTLDKYNVNHTFFSAFQVVSAFQNAGFGLLDSSLTEFQRAFWMLTVLGALVLLGNTMYAPTMRGVIYGLERWVWRGEGPRRDGLRYLLAHPRKCFTHLFPFHQTLWLTITVVLFNAVELFFFCVLDWNISLLDGLSAGMKLFDGLFQSLQTRSAGLSVFFIAALSPAMLVLYLGMMYIAVYPVFLTRQNSKASPEVLVQKSPSEDKQDEYDSLDVGTFQEPTQALEDKGITSQARVLVARDSAFLFLSIFLISIVQSAQIRNDPNYGIFNILFEVISAYGNVGLSVGYTCVPPAGGTCQSPPYAFSGEWKVLSKLILILVMLMGRHRGLPENIDSAVRLPSRRFFGADVRVEDSSSRRIKEEYGLVDPVEKVLLLRMTPNDVSPKPSLFKSISRRLGGESSFENSFGNKE